MFFSKHLNLHFGCGRFLKCRNLTIFYTEILIRGKSWIVIFVINHNSYKILGTRLSFLNSVLKNMSKIICESRFPQKSIYLDILFLLFCKICFIILSLLTHNVLKTKKIVKSHKMLILSKQQWLFSNKLPLFCGFWAISRITAGNKKK